MTKSPLFIWRYQISSKKVVIFLHIFVAFSEYMIFPVNLHWKSIYYSKHITYHFSNRKFVLGKFSWRSFEDFASEATIVSQALRNLGLNPRDKVAILAETRAEWILTAYACFKNNITIVTIYTNLGNDGIAHALNETQVPLLICSDETLPKVRTNFC